jgi:hypothetical protein
MRPRLKGNENPSLHADYSAEVIRAAKQAGLEVLPYRRPLGKRVLGTTSKQTVLVNGVPCQICCRRHDHGTTCGGRYVQFRIGRGTNEIKVVVFAVWKGRKLKLYVVPTRRLLNVSVILLPFRG